MFLTSVVCGCTGEVDAFVRQRGGTGQPLRRRVTDVD